MYTVYSRLMMYIVSIGNYVKIWAFVVEHHSWYQITCLSSTVETFFFVNFANFKFNKVSYQFLINLDTRLFLIKNKGNHCKTTFKRQFNILSGTKLPVKQYDYDSPFNINNFDGAKNGRG